MLIPRLQYGFRFLVRFPWTGENLKLSKFSPILNQLAIEDAASVDAVIGEFYEKLNWDELSLAAGALTAKANLLLWRRQAPNSFLRLKVFSLDGLIKFNLDSPVATFINNTDIFQYKSRLKNWRRLKRSRIRKTLQFMHLSGLSWSSEYGFRGSLKKKLKNFLTFQGSARSYRKRRQMLGRKVNFRQKVKKKKLTEY